MKKLIPFFLLLVSCVKLGINEYRQNIVYPFMYIKKHVDIQWWYQTGIVEAKKDTFFYQFTIFRSEKPIPGYVLHIALLDVKSDRHYFFHNVKLSSILQKRVGFIHDTLFFDKYNYISFNDDTVFVDAKLQGVGLHLISVSKKPPVFHGVDSFIIMGHPDVAREKSFYMSFTRLKDSGYVLLENDTLNVHGESWFDRQWGSFSEYGWDWFSLRFFDNTEMMLFGFPKKGYNEGTYIDFKGNAEHIKSFSYTVDSFYTGCKNKRRFGLGWKIHIKERSLHVTPVSFDQYNCWGKMDYWEGLCRIFEEDSLVGYAIVETIWSAHSNK